MQRNEEEHGPSTGLFSEGKGGAAFASGCPSHRGVVVFEEEKRSGSFLLS